MTSPRKVYSRTVQEEQRPKPEAPAPEPEGLIGYYGHTFITREGKRQLQFQFRIVRALPPDRWVVQFYSFMDGCPNKLGIYSESYLLSEDCALYLDAARGLRRLLTERAMNDDNPNAHHTDGPADEDAYRRGFQQGSEIALQVVRSGMPRRRLERWRMAIYRWRFLRTDTRSELRRRSQRDGRMKVPRDRQ